jgi:Glycosyl hydrolase 36 superfamily, catalytic domain/Glycosyltransferase family 36
VRHPRIANALASALVTALTLVAAGAGASASSAAAPPLLSLDHSTANLDSTYGSGHFGSWSVDEFGLPTYRYGLDEAVDPRAAQAENSGSTLAQHQVGNDHLMANAYNDGFVQLWSQDRLMQWANLYQPASQHYSGGYGYLKVGNQVLSTLYADRPKGSDFQREFGVGYYRKSLAAAGVAVTQTTLAPFGNDPLLIDEVTIRNTTAAPLKTSWFEYWDVNPYDQATGFQNTIGLLPPAYDSASRTLSVAQLTAPEGDTNPLSIFASALNAPDGGHETSIKAFFGSGTRTAPAEVSGDALSGSIAAPRLTGTAGDTLFAFRAPVSLAPGQSVTLRYAYGIAHPDQIAKLVSSYRAAADPFGDSERAWAGWVPQADFGPANRWVAREIAWDAYQLRSASMYEEVCGHHTITQGGYYQYDTGANLGYRSWPHYLLPMTYADPSLTRDVLRYTIVQQPPPPTQAQQNPYGIGQLCTRFDLGTSNDLDLWLLLAAGEYGLGMRDTTFFDEQLPYAGTGQTATAWEHIREAFAHQESLLGPHGGYTMGSTGDWNDFSTELEQMTESMLVTAQTAYVYPKLAELADLRGDTAFAGQLRAAAARNVATLRNQWTGKGWYSRGYSGPTQVGKGVIFEEPQPWAVLAGAPSASQARTLVGNIRRYLDAVGAPSVVGGPALYGTAQSPSRLDPGVTELGPVATAVAPLPAPIEKGLPSSSLNHASEWPGGVWFDLNGNLTWAYGTLDGVVPGARALAWDEYTRNTVARHATLWPDHWAGTISVDDVCHAWYSNDPERCGTGLSQTYDGQITEQPTWMVMDAIRLAGLTPTGAGYDIAPHLPFAHFSLRLPRIGIASEASAMRGYVTPESDGPFVMTVHLPAGIAGASATTWADGVVVAHRSGGSLVRFGVTGHRGVPADWAVTWSAPARTRRMAQVRCTSHRSVHSRRRAPQRCVRHRRPRRP